MHIRNTHVQFFTQNTFFRSNFYAEYPNGLFFYANYPRGVNFYAKYPRVSIFPQTTLRGIILGGKPLGGCLSGFAGEDVCEHTAGRETATLSNVLDLAIRLLGHETLRFLDTQVVDPLEERTTILGVDELTQISAVKRQHLMQVG